MSHSTIRDCSARRWRPTRCGSATTRWCSPSGSASGSPARRSSRRTSRSPTSRSTCSARPARCSPYAGEVEGAGRDEDDLAYLRDEREFRNVQLVELRNGDFAVTMARQLLFSTYQLALYERLHEQRPTRRSPASRPRRSRRSTTTATTPPSGCCGSATAPTSRTARMQAGLERVWPYVDELFEHRRRSSSRWSADGRRRRPSTLRARVGRVRRRGARRGDARPARSRAGRAPGGAARHPHRGARLPAGRDAAPAPRAPGGDLVNACRCDARRRARGGGRGACSTPRCRC